MLDVQLLRKQPEMVAERLAKKKHSFQLDVYLKKEAQRKSLQTELESLKSDMNRLAKAIAQADKEDQARLSSRAAEIKARIKRHETAFNKVVKSLNEILMTTPNLPHDSVPAGDSSEDNVVIHNWGKTKSLPFRPLDHFDAAEKLGLTDNRAASLMSGSRYMILLGDLAKLHRALAAFMMDVQTREHGYQEVYVPYIVHETALEGTGQLPKFKDDLFALKPVGKGGGANESYLIPTAEVPLSNLLREKIIPAAELPLKYVAQTPCFRSEAGNYGKDLRGIFRQHQFEKIELVQISKPEDSWQALEEITRHAEAVLQKLELPYRVISLCGGDLGFASAKTYDLEVWLQGQGKYREVSSCSNMSDFQARRMQARFRRSAGSKPELVHTLNGSGLAVGRTLIAILENYQDAEGNIHVPPALQPHMGGQKIIAVKKKGK